MARTVSASLCILILAVVLSTAAFGIRYTKAIQTAYRRGWDDATLEVRKEAIRNGHAYWTRSETGQNGFAWVDVHREYNADRPADQPIDKLFPEPTDDSLLKRILQ